MVKHAQTQVDLLTAVALFSLGEGCRYPKPPEKNTLFAGRLSNTS